MPVNTLIVQFKNPISRHEIALFRGAVIEGAGEDCPILFHNHKGEQLRYGYPLIQYKRIHGRAAIVCVGQGCNEIGAFFSHSNFQLQLGRRAPELFEIDHITPHRTQVQLWDDAFHYWLRDWLPLNHDNYHAYLQAQGLAERIQLLEKILLGNILSACKGMDVTIDDELTCRILDLETPRKEIYKGTPVMRFNCQFATNITLPDYIGLGKGVSRGQGIVVRQKKRINNQDETQ